jgi:hypothetical protein
MGQKTTQEIIEATKEYFCYGLDYPDLAIRIDTARRLPAESVVVDFGTGQGRYAITMAMANPYIQVFTFDCGRRDMTNTELINRTINRINEQGVGGRVFFTLADSREALPDFEWPVSILSIDSDGGYEVSKGEIARWFPLVKRGGSIFIQSYGYGGIYTSGEKYPGLRMAVDEYLIEHPEYHLVEKVY